jgi:hypothetical protein
MWFLPLITLIYIISGCKVVKEENRECEDTRMVESQSVVVYLIIQPATDSLFSVVPDLFPNGRVDVEGTITRVCCNGTIGDSDPFHQVINFSAIDGRSSYQGTLVDQPFRFTFRNERDYLLLSMNMKGVDPASGKEWTSGNVQQRYYFRNVTYDMLRSRYTIKFRVPSTSAAEEADPE